MGKSFIFVRINAENIKDTSASLRRKSPIIKKIYACSLDKVKKRKHLTEPI
jgi:hypothetical protein